MDKLPIIFGLLIGVFVMWAHIKHSSYLPGKDILAGFEGRKTRGAAEINGINYYVTFIVNEEQLAINSFGPGFALILGIEDLSISKCKAIIGTQIKIESADPYLQHMVSEIIVSHQSAKKIDLFSNGRLGYENV